MEPPEYLYSKLSYPAKCERVKCLTSLQSSERLEGQVVDILLEIENVPSTIIDCREKERHLEILLKDLRSIQASQSELTQACAFHHLLGSLYINFEKFWGPTTRAVISLLQQTKYQQTLLDSLLKHLTLTNEYIYDASKRRDIIDDGSRPDHVLHRNFIFQILGHFTSYVEANSQIFMDQFFLFIDKEIRIYPFIDVLPTRDLSTIKEESYEANELSQYSEPDSVSCQKAKDDIPASSNKVKKPKKLSSKKMKFQDPIQRAIVIEKRKSRETFITAVKILQSSSSVLQIHRESEFKNLIMELLCCRDISIQKAAFNCLCAYNQESIISYRDIIKKILNVNQIRSELSVFSLDAEGSCLVAPSHRMELIPVIQRIIFGRMISQIGKKTEGGDKAGKRRDYVMRFMSGCSNDEIRGFFDLLFRPISGYLEMDYQQLEGELRGDTDIHRFIPINKIQAMIDTLDSFMKSLGYSKRVMLPYCFKIINIISCKIELVLNSEEHSNQIHRRNLEALKGVRRSTMAVMIKFLKSFDYYSFSQSEIDFIFDHMIWPSSRDFIDRNHASVTPLLRLVEVFCHCRIYHNLLIKRNKINPDECLIAHLLSLYASEKASRAVTKAIGNMIADILTPDRNILENLDQEEASHESDQIQDKDSKMFPYDASLYRLPDCGLKKNHAMILPFSPMIFERLSSLCRSFIEKKDSEYRFEDSELSILSILSSYITDSTLCAVATDLLLSTLGNLKNHDLIVNTIKTTQNLMKNATCPIDSTIVNKIADILYFQRDQEQRKELCTLLAVLAEIDSGLCQASYIIHELNSMNKDLVDTPDLGKWNTGFQKAFKYLEALDANHINHSSSFKYSINLLLHQVGYIINSIDRYEFSIRDNCLIFYEHLSQKLQLINHENNRSYSQEIIQDLLLDKFIKKGLRNTNEMIKNLYIGIIRILAMNCADKNNILGELKLFCNLNPDLDFWLGIKSIQLHNRSKALARLLNDENLKKVNPKTLSSYFMPIASAFLFNRNYKSLASLIENSIKLIGIICQSLNWNTYESTLNYYLGLLTSANAVYQRTNIKLINEILRNFNFDLTTCEEAMVSKSENDRLEKRMRKRLGLLSHEADSIEVNSVQRKHLNPSSARAVYFSVTKKIIPRLNSCLHEMTRVEFEHDKNMTDYIPEKDEIKRIPVAFAIVQLLSLLPCKYIHLRDQLPALFLKLVSFLKSKNESTRKTARATLIRIMKFLEPIYILDLLRVMRQNLDKGFHIHVLNYTINAVLEQTDLDYGDLDVVSHGLIEVCLDEIFGRPSEDKDIARITAKTAEARKTKSYDTLQILCKYISDEKLSTVIGPLREKLKTANEAKIVNKLSVCLQRVFSGLSENSHFPLNKLLDFIRSTIDESMPDLKTHNSSSQLDNSRRSLVLREDRFLIKEKRNRDSLQSRINERGNLHMMIENSLRLLLLVFEKNKSILRNDLVCQQQLDDLVQLLAVCLKSSSPRCVTRSLKCLHFLGQTKIELPSFEIKCNSIIKKIFILLHLYNGVGMAKGDNNEMIAMCFRNLTLLLNKCQHVELKNDQIRALISYIEQDLNDSTRQSTAFKTLHSLILKKYQSPELPSILDHVAETLVTSDDDNLRLYSFKIWRTYLLHYQHESDHLQVYLNRFLRQLDYEHIDGRKSVLKMLRSIVEKFPETVLRRHLELFFYLLAQRVINDEERDIRHLVGRLIGLILQRLPDKQVYLLNKFILPWASCENIGISTLGLKLLSIFSESCIDQFHKDRDLNAKVLSIILRSLQREPETKPDVKPESQSSLDNKNLYHSLRLFERLINKSVIAVLDVKHMDVLKRIWQVINANLLCHNYESVVKTSATLYLQFISSTNLADALKSEISEKDDYVSRNSTKIVVSLCDKYLVLLDKFRVDSEIYSLAAQSLILLGRMVVNSRFTIEFESKYLNAFENHDIISHILLLDNIHNDGFVEENLPYAYNESKRRGNLIWLSTKIIMQARREAALHRLSQSHRRSFVLKWLAAISQELGSERISTYIFLFMTTPARELTDKGKTTSHDETSQNNLVQLSEDLLKFFKGLLGPDTFNQLYSKVQLHYTKKRVERKKSEAILKVQNQSKGVKRKLAHSKDKDQKRRKSKNDSRKRRILAENGDIRTKMIRSNRSKI